MNKLRLIRIFELRGKVHPIEAAIIDLLDGIEIILTGNFIEYKKNGKDYFLHNLNTNNLWIFYPYPIINIFKCNIEERRVIMKYLLEKHLKLKINEVR